MTKTMCMKKIIAFVLLQSLLSFTMGWAQKPVKVHGTARLSISETDNITPMEARRECINRARVDAIRAEFGELITFSSNILDYQIDGEEMTRFVEETDLSAQAEWVEDTREPKVKMEVQENYIIYTAEVWGLAREIPQAHIDFSWKILRGDKNDTEEQLVFNNKQRIFIQFRSPIAGYVAVYLLDSTHKEASCLLPYKHNPRGQHYVQAGKDYLLFDREADPKAIPYNLVTTQPLEMDQVVLIFSPNPFTKCNEITGDHRHPNSLSIEDFEAWLKRLRLRDRDMVIDRSKWVKIVGSAI